MGLDGRVWVWKRCENRRKGKWKNVKGRAGAMWKEENTWTGENGVWKGEEENTWTEENGVWKGEEEY